MSATCCSTPATTPKIGDRVIVRRQSGSGHNYKLGTTYTISAFNPSGVGTPQQLVQLKDDKGKVGNWIYCNEFDLWPLNREQLNARKAALDEEIAKLVAEKGDVDTKLEYMDANGLDTYDENEYRIFRALGVLDAETDRMKRAKLLAEILKG